MLEKNCIKQIAFHQVKVKEHFTPKVIKGLNILT